MRSILTVVRQALQAAILLVPLSLLARADGATYLPLIANQPTRGLDVGSIEFIYRRIVEVRDSGVGVLLISAELDEITSLSDRIAVMYAGRIVATLDAATADRETLGLLMAGAYVEGVSKTPPEPEPA